MRPPVRAHHVGSLLRPSGLRAAYRRHRRGEIGDDEFRWAQDEAIRHVVALQEDLGLRVVTDGELRRTSYWSRFVAAVDGLEVGMSRFKFTDATGDRLPCSAKDFFADLSAIYRAEIADLAARGATLVQLDEGALAMLCDPAVRRRVGSAGEVPGQLVDDYAAAIAEAGADRPEGVTLALHLCRGKGHWLAEGGYEPVAEAIFGGTGVDMQFLEFDSARAGGFEPLRRVPATTFVVLGLVSSKTPELEPRDELLRRIDEASRYVDVERLALSPQCGFASTAGGNPLSEDDERRKLGLVVDACQEVWGGP